MTSHRALYRATFISLDIFLQISPLNFFKQNLFKGTKLSSLFCYHDVIVIRVVRFPYMGLSDGGLPPEWQPLADLRLKRLFFIFFVAGTASFEKKT